MNSVKTIAWGVAGCWLVTTSVGLSQEPEAASVPPQRQVEEVVSHLVGVMDTSAQAAANPKAVPVRMTTCKVQVQDAPPSVPDRPAVFLYQEQALTEKLSQPYRQRFLQIAPSRDGKTVQSLSFKPTQTAAWAGLCNQPERDRLLTLKDLGTPICSVWLKRSGADYVGRTPIDGCPANVRGAVRITNRIVLHADGMDTWDRGFDAKGQQVWGAASNAYQFRWVKPK